MTTVTKAKTIAKPKKKKKSRIYFGKDVQNAIIEYNSLDDSHKIYKDSLFKITIYPAFKKMAENLINTYKIRRYETTFKDLQTDTITELFNKIQGYRPTAGRAYSYFTIIARNFLWNYSKKRYKHATRTGDVMLIDHERDLNVEISESDYKSTLKSFMVYWAEWMESNITSIFRSQRDRKIATALVELFKTSSDIDIYNKKSLYILIRESTNVETQHITKVVKSFRVLFLPMFQEFRKNGFIDSSKYLS